MPTNQPYNELTPEDIAKNANPSSALQQRESINAYTEEAKARDVVIKSLKDSVRAQKEVGKSYEEIAVSMEKARIATDTTKQAMGAYYKTIGEIITIFKADPAKGLKEATDTLGGLAKGAFPLSTALGGATIAVSLLVTAFKALDSAGAQLNRTFAAVGSQMGGITGSGFGGVGGRIGIRGAGEEENRSFRQSLTETTARLTNLGYTSEQITQLYSGIASRLPGLMGARSTGKVADIISASSSQFGMTEQTASDMLINSFRRTSMSGSELLKQFEGMAEGAKVSKLSNTEYTNGVNMLWNATYRYGATLKDAEATMKLHSDAVRQDLLTTQELAQMKSSAGEMGPGQVMGLAVMMRKFSPELAGQVFGGATSPNEVLSNFVKNIDVVVNNISKINADVIKGGGQSLFGGGAGGAFLAKMLPSMYGQNVTTAMAKGLGVFGPVSTEGGEVPKDLGVFSGVVSENVKVAKALQDTTTAVWSFGKSLKILTTESLKENNLVASPSNVGKTALNMIINNPSSVLNESSKEMREFGDGVRELWHKIFSR